MGSFNTVCAVSGMPIQPDDKVKLFFLLSQDYRMTNGCYFYDFWKPITFGISATYDDYNQYRDIDENKPVEKLLLHYLRSSAVKMEEGENKYHDIPVDPASINFENLFKFLHEERLFIKQSFTNDNCPVALVAIHDCVWEKLINSVYKNWRGDEISIDSIFSKIMKKYEESVEDVLAESETSETTRRLIISFSLTSIFKMDSIDTLYDISKFDMEDTVEVERLVKDIAKMTVFDYAMETNNQTWHPVPTGGQDIDYENNIKFHQSIIDCINIKKKEYDEYYDYDDYDEDK